VAGEIGSDIWWTYCLVFEVYWGVSEGMIFK
jgi:hypothetical protein